MNEAMVHPTSILDEGVVLGDGTRVWQFCHLQTGASVGERCILGQNVNLGPGVQVGRGVKIQNNVSVYQGVTLEDHVFCGPSAVFTNDRTPRAPYPKGPDGYLPTLVREGATIGANATILSGLTIGRWAMVAAGAVVTKDVPSHRLVAGTPARAIGWICRCGCRLDREFRCPACGRKHRIQGKIKNFPKQ